MAPEVSVPTTVELSTTQLLLESVGAWTEIGVVVRDQDGAAMTDVAPAFSSSDGTVASVTATGIVTAVANGVSTVTVQAGAASADVAVTVDQWATSVEASADTINFADPGDSVTVSVLAMDALGADAAGTVAWSSGNSGVATVSGSGVVHAVATGTTVVIASAGAASDSIVVRVAPELDVVIVGGSTVQGPVASHVTLAGRVEDLAGAAWSGGHVSWSVGAGSGSIVSAQEVQSDITGHVGAVWQLGTTSGTQRAFAQIESRGQTKVVEFLADATAAAAVSASLVADSVLLSAVGESVFLGPSYLDEWGNNTTSGAATWVTRDAGVATVSTDGLVVGSGVGQTYILPVVGSATDSILVTVVPRGAITITFDDGWRTVYENAWPVFQEFDLPANVGVYTGVVGAPAFMTEAHLDELHTGGWSMASHTVSHDSLTTMSPAELDFELRVSKEWIDARGYRGTNVLIAPYHEFEETERVAASQYYVAARGQSANEFVPDSLVSWLPSNPYELTGIDAEGLPYTSQAGRDRLRDLLQRTVDEGAFLDVYFHQIPPGNVDALRATLEVIDDFRARVLPYHDLFPIFARSVF